MDYDRILNPLGWPRPTRTLKLGTARGIGPTGLSSPKHLNKYFYLTILINRATTQDLNRIVIESFPLLIIYASSVKVYLI
jgi:hypothetical protein